MKGLWHGHGILYNTDGRILYEGDFDGGKYHGNGTLYSSKRLKIHHRLPWSIYRWQVDWLQNIARGAHHHAKRARIFPARGVCIAHFVKYSNNDGLRFVHIHDLRLFTDDFLSEVVGMKDLDLERFRSLRMFVAAEHAASPCESHRRPIYGGKNPV